MANIPAQVKAKIEQYKQGIEIAKTLYDAYVTGVADSIGIDLTKQFFNGNDFVDRNPPEQKKEGV